MPVKKTKAFHGTFIMDCLFAGESIPSQVDWEQTVVCLNHKVVKTTDLKFALIAHPSLHRSIKVFNVGREPYTAYSQQVFIEFNLDAPQDFRGETLHNHEIRQSLRSEIAKHLIGWNVGSLVLEVISEKNN